MSQVTITGKFHNHAPLLDLGTFRKQVLFVEVVNGTYVSYFPIEFHNDDIDKFAPILVPQQDYTFTCWVQGSKTVVTNSRGELAAYVNLKCTNAVPAQAQQAPAPQAQPQAQGGFGAPQAQPQAQAQGGFVGAPQAPAPAQGGFGQPAQAPAQENPQAQGGFGQPAPTGFGQ